MRMSSVSTSAKSFHSGEAALKRIWYLLFEVLPPDDDGHPPTSIRALSMTQRKFPPPSCHH